VLSAFSCAGSLRSTETRQGYLGGSLPLGGGAGPRGCVPVALSSQLTSEPPKPKHLPGLPLAERESSGRALPQQCPQASDIVDMSNYLAGTICAVIPAEANAALET
jgi:hypothetical protein